MKKHYRDVFGFYNTTFEIDKIHQLATGKKRALEIGCYIGKSSVAIAMNVESLLCIDPFDCHNSELDSIGNLKRKETINNLQAFLDNIEGYDNIQYIIGLSHEVIPTLNQTFDYIYIDGDHSFEGVKRDLDLCWPILERNGVLVMHDYANYEGYDMGIKKAFDCKFKTYDGLQDSVVWKVKK